MATQPGARAPSPPARPRRLRSLTRFLASPVEELYREGFFEVRPDEIRIRLRARDGRVEMVVFAAHQGRVDELVLDFEDGEVFAELCG